MNALIAIGVATDLPEDQSDPVLDVLRDDDEALVLVQKLAHTETKDRGVGLLELLKDPPPTDRLPLLLHFSDQEIDTTEGVGSPDPSFPDPLGELVLDSDPVTL